MMLSPLSDLLSLLHRPELKTVISVQVVALQQQHKGADDAVRRAKELAIKLKSEYESECRTYK